MKIKIIFCCYIVLSVITLISTQMSFKNHEAELTLKLFEMIESHFVSDTRQIVEQQLPEITVEIARIGRSGKSPNDASLKKRHKLLFNQQLSKTDLEKVVVVIKKYNTDNKPYLTMLSKQYGWYMTVDVKYDKTSQDILLNYDFYSDPSKVHKKN